MSRNKYNSKIKGIFDEMDDHDISEAMKGKDRIWASLDVNKKKTKGYNGLLWFVLGLLLALAGVFMKKTILDSRKAPEVIYAEVDKPENWETKISRLEDKIIEMEQRYEAKSSIIDSLNLYNQKLQSELQTMASINRKSNSSNVEIQYVKDTVYLTKVKKEIVELERILRDTIIIEVPIIENGENLMTDIGNNPDEIDDVNLTNLKDSFKKTKPTSVQFNFKKVKSKKD